MPLPHISTSPPSALKICILKSAASEGLRTKSWSQPTPKRRSQIDLALASISGIEPLTPFRTKKSLPTPCIFVNFYVIPHPLPEEGGNFLSPDQILVGLSFPYNIIFRAVDKDFGRAPAGVVVESNAETIGPGGEKGQEVSAS